LTVLTNFVLNQPASLNLFHAIFHLNWFSVSHPAGQGTTDVTVFFNFGGSHKHSPLPIRKYFRTKGWTHGVAMSRQKNKFQPVS